MSTRQLIPATSATALVSSFTPVRSGLLQRKCACGGTPGPGGECEQCRKKRMNLQRRAAPQPSSFNPQLSEVPPIVHEVLRSPGQPLAPATRAFMEPRFGHDFGQVRVHTDARSAESARAVNALAYTVGRNVVFGAGHYAPATIPGRSLLAHELAHVAQQRHAPEAPGEPALAGARWEREADAAAAAVAAGKTASIAQRAETPLLARFSESKTMTEGDGAKVQVDRVITPGQCALKPESRTKTKGDITGTQAFVEFDFCKGRVGSTARAELNYGEAIDKARAAASNLASNLASQRPDQALQTFKDEVNQIAPQGQVRVNLQAPGLRITLGGKGEVSGGAGPSGEGTFEVNKDIGPFTVGGKVTVKGGKDQETTTEGLVTIGTRDRAKKDRNCFICVCPETDIQFLCLRKDPPGTRPPPTPTPQPVIVPLFFEYEKTEARRDWKDEYQKALVLAASRIRDGYSVARIEGNASPEGPEAQRQRSKFVGNVELARLRAVEAKNDLDAILQRTFSLTVKGTKSVQAALKGSYPVEGKGELFGATEKGEVANKDLFGHLKTTLREPPEGGADPLAAAHVTGQGLPADIEAEAQKGVEEFRSGKRGDKKLSKEEQLEAVYRPLRRALIFLEPPPTEPIFLVGRPLPSETVAAVIGKHIDCTDEHKKLFAGSLPPKSEMFTGECNEHGKRTEDEGSR